MVFSGIREAFQVRYGKAPEFLVFAPGRINLIGEHTDYNGGFVFPAAIELGITIAACRSDSEQCELYSDRLGEGQSFTLADDPSSVEGWSRFAAGMARMVQGQSPIQCLVSSDLPVASGVSSSAALEVAFGLLWREMDRLNLSMHQIALLAKECENKIIGVQCGVMDMMASACSIEGHAMLLDTQILTSQSIPFPDDWVIAICDTGKPRALTESAYNERRDQCNEASRQIGKPLREASLEDVAIIADPVLQARARHVVSENDRCLLFAEALERRDRSAICSLMSLSHASLRDDYEVSCVELDEMAKVCLASPGCIGARMTGAGFGGACVALVESDQQREFKAACEHLYQLSVKGYSGSVTFSKAGAGARVLAGI